jgi:3-methylfumaryl-CoA hydratase
MDDSSWAAWEGRETLVAGRIDAAPAHLLAATLDTAFEVKSDELLPALWYWIYFQPTVATSGLGPDGHPKRGGFLPPIPLERRMWAGSRVQFHAALRIGEEIEKTSKIQKIARKEGKTGPMVFVTVRRSVRGEHGIAVDEEQDVVFLPMPKEFRPPSPTRPPKEFAWTMPRPADPVLLFRFSAVTFNAHRIHYDRNYAMTAEKYPGLVVHGPLQALLLFEAVRERHAGKIPARFEFRGLQPLFDFDTLTLAGKPREDGGEDLFTVNGRGEIATQAAIHWKSDG